MSTDPDGASVEDGVTRLDGDEDDPALAGLAVAVGSSFLTIATALLVTDGPLAVFGNGSGATLTIGTEAVVGWTFLAAHSVPIEVAAERWHLAGELVQSPVIYAVPPVTLLVGGYLVARLDECTGTVPGARAGALVTVGYALVTAVAVFGTRVSVQSSYASIAAYPNIPLGLVAGVAYPVLFAGMGGAVAGGLTGRLDEIPRFAETVAIAVVGVTLMGAVVVAALG